MFKKMIDAHIHFDDYNNHEQVLILDDLKKDHIDSLISVSKNLHSAKQVQKLAKKFEAIKPAYGFHPEQIYPKETELIALTQFMEEHANEMVAIGEVGLPFYLKQEDPSVKIEAYIELLEYFIKLAKKYEKPVILHAVYEDALIACDLLEKHSIKQAHFHWFKGDNKTIERLIANEYHISVTPDICYKQKTRKLVESYPLQLMMVETDGPWTFSGPFKNQMTHPKMMHMSIRKIAKVKNLPVEEVYQFIFNTTKDFFLRDP